MYVTYKCLFYWSKSKYNSSSNYAHCLPNIRVYSFYDLSRMQDSLLLYRSTSKLQAVMAAAFLTALLSIQPMLAIMLQKERKYIKGAGSCSEVAHQKINKICGSQKPIPALHTTITGKFITEILTAHL